MSHIYFVAGLPYSDDLFHSGVKGMRKGVRRYQNEDGSLTPLGRRHYGIEERQPVALRAHEPVGTSSKVQAVSGPHSHGNISQQSSTLYKPASSQNKVASVHNANGPKQVNVHLGSRPTNSSHKQNQGVKDTVKAGESIMRDYYLHGGVSSGLGGLILSAFRASNFSKAKAETASSSSSSQAKTTDNGKAYVSSFNTKDVYLDLFSPKTEEQKELERINDEVTQKELDAWKNEKEEQAKRKAKRDASSAASKKIVQDGTKFLAKGAAFLMKLRWRGI